MLSIKREEETQMEQNDNTRSGVRTITRLVSERMGRPCTEQETRLIHFIVDKFSVPLNDVHALVDNVYKESAKLELDAMQRRKEFLESIGR